MVAAVSLTASPGLAAVMVKPGDAERGIDISAYQNANGLINWRELVRHGIKFVVIKASEDTYYTNPYYLSDAAGGVAGGPGRARLRVRQPRPGRRRGHRQLRRPGRALPASPRALPLVVDLENDPYSRSDCYWFGRGRMIAWIARFAARAKALTGSWPIIYTTAAWWQECTGSTGQFTNDPLWLANYDGGPPSTPSPWAGGRSGSTPRPATCPGSI